MGGRHRNRPDKRTFREKSYDERGYSVGYEDARKEGFHKGTAFLLHQEKQIDRRQHLGKCYYCHDPRPNHLGKHCPQKGIYTCHRCGEKGHRRAECTKELTPKVEKNSRARRTERRQQTYAPRETWNYEAIPFSDVTAEDIDKPSWEEQVISDKDAAAGAAQVDKINNGKNDKNYSKEKSNEKESKSKRRQVTASRRNQSESERATTEARAKNQRKLNKNLRSGLPANSDLPRSD